jgi:hypothetical protein
VTTESTAEPPKTETTKPEAAKKSPKTKPGITEEPAETVTPSEKTKPQETAAPLPGARLIIEEKDGTRIERPMSSVRRVIVEGSAIVVILKSGKIERIAMTDVLRMAIEPQP